MDINIIGPNLPDQSKGYFHIHRADCCDGIRLARQTGEGWIVDCASRCEATVEVYGDQLNEDASWASCRSDLWFCPCTKELPEGQPPGDEDNFVRRP